MNSRILKFAAIALGSLAGSSINAEIQILSMTGESLGEGLTAEGYSTPSLNKYGEIAFAANAEELNTGNSSRFESILFYNTTGLHLLAATDQVAPKPGNDGVFEFFDAPSITELGIAMYRAKPRGSSWAVNERGIWISWLVNDPQGAYAQTDILGRVWDRAIIDFLGNESENGGKYGLLSNPIPVEPLSFAFVGDLYEGDYDDVSGIWYQDARGSETWNIPEPRLLALTSLPLAGNNLVLDRIESYAPIDTEGGIALARLAQGGEITSDNDLALWKLQLEGNANLLLRTGDTDSTTDAPIDAIGKPSANDSGTAAVWVGIRDENESEAVYIVSDQGLQTIAVSNAPVSVGNIALEIDSIYDPIIDDNGDIAFLATLISENLIPQYALLLKRSDSPLELVARTGDQAPGTFAGTIYQTINAPRLNNAGGIAFMATLGGSGDTISDTTDSGIWAHDGNGDLVLALREGNTIEARNNEFRTLSGFEIGGYNAFNEIALKMLFSNGDSAIASVSVEPAAPPTIADQPSDTNTYLGETVTLSVNASGQGPFLFQWYLNGELIAGANQSTLTINTATLENAGNYSVAVQSPVGETESAVAALQVFDLPDIPVIVEQPLGYIALLGESAALDARAVANSSVSYQWYKNGSMLSGANSDTLWIDQTDNDDEAEYHVVASTQTGSAQSETAEVLVTDKRLVNISTRAHVGTGSNVLITGFVIGGSERKTVLIRAVGPTLSSLNVDNVLENPKLTLHGSTGIIAENTGWASQSNKSEIAEAAQSVGAFELPTDSEDAVMLIELDPGLYTAIVNGENNTTGIALVEVYEVGANASRLINISSRAHVGIDQNVVIPGLVALGDLPTKVLVRAIGPGLEGNNLTGLLEHPVLEVLNSQGEVIAANDGWNGNPSINEAGALVGAFPIDEESDDAAMIIALEPGLYTIKISGEDGTTGLALVELYAIP